MMGVQHCGALASAIEQAAKSGAGMPFARQVDELRAEFSQSVSVLQAMNSGSK
jgi:hypothetical protein